MLFRSALEESLNEASEAAEAAEEVKEAKAAEHAAQADAAQVLSADKLDFFSEHRCMKSEVMICVAE